MCILLFALSVNAITACSAFVTLKRKLHNTLIICLWVNNVVVSLTAIIHKICKLFLHKDQTRSLCLMAGVSFSYSLSTSYAIIFLVGWLRFKTIKSFNIGIDFKFERYKYVIVGGTHILTLSTSIFANIFLPTKARKINICSPYHMYEENYQIYIGMLWGPLTILLIFVIVIYVLNAIYIWKIFFKEHLKIWPVDRAPRPGSKPNEYESPMRSDKSVLFLQNMGHQTESEMEVIQEIPCRITQNTASSSTIEFNQIKIEIENQSHDDREGQVQDLTGTQNNTNNTTLDRSRVEKKNTKRCKQERTHNSGTTAYHVDRRWEIRAFTTNILIASTSIFLSLPFVSSLWYDLFANEVLSFQTQNIMFYINAINYILDPFIYAFTVPEIRKKLKHLVCKQSDNSFT